MKQYILQNPIGNIKNTPSLNRCKTLREKHNYHLIGVVSKGIFRWVK